MHLTALPGSYIVSSSATNSTKEVESTSDDKVSEVVFMGDTRMGKTESMTLNIQCTKENRTVLRDLSRKAEHGKSHWEKHKACLTEIQGTAALAVSRGSATASWGGQNLQSWVGTQQGVRGGIQTGLKEQHRKKAKGHLNYS